jgi:hypothetical protein
LREGKPDVAAAEYEEAVRALYGRIEEAVAA